MEVSFYFCQFLCLGAFHDLQSPMVSTSSGLGMDGDCNHRGKLCVNISSNPCAFRCLYVSLYIESPVFICFFLLFPPIVKFFVIGHDCAHKSFSKNKLVEDIVGTLAFMPLIYPYEPWRFKHDQHHAKTNM